MRTTIALDDDLLTKAQAFTGLKEKSVLVHEALRALICLLYTSISRTSPPPPPPRREMTKAHRQIRH